MIWSWILLKASSYAKILILLSLQVWYNSLYVSLLFAVSLTNVVFLATIDVAVGGFARVGRVGFTSSEGLMNFHTSLLLAEAIVLIINKKGSQVSEWTSITGLDDIFRMQFSVIGADKAISEQLRFCRMRKVVRIQEGKVKLIIQMIFSERIK